MEDWYRYTSHHDDSALTLDLTQVSAFLLGRRKVWIALSGCVHCPGRNFGRICPKSWINFWLPCLWGNVSVPSAWTGHIGTGIVPLWCQCLLKGKMRMQIYFSKWLSKMKHWHRLGSMDLLSWLNISLTWMSRMCSAKSKPTLSHERMYRLWALGTSIHCGGIPIVHVPFIIAKTGFLSYITCFLP